LALKGFIYGNEYIPAGADGGFLWILRFAYKFVLLAVLPKRRLFLHIYGLKMCAFFISGIPLFLENTGGL